MPQHIEDLPTPALLIERHRVQDNIDRMQAFADREGVVLRPHTKTHKSVAIAKVQQERGARGITVAKTGEAEVFVKAGFEDVRIASTVIGQEKWERIAELAGRCRISFLVDTMAGARAAAAFFDEAGVTVDVLIEVDTGYHRCGVDPASDEAIELARFLSDARSLNLVGILTHAGHGYYGPKEGEQKPDALKRVADQERDLMLGFASRLREAGIPGVEPGAFDISVGSTPTMAAFTNREMDDFRITEIRPGNFVFNDMIQVGLEAARLTECALTVWSTVISRHRDRSGQERLYLDAGKKALTSDTGAETDGFGTILFNASSMAQLPHARIVALSEEHGWVRVPGGATIDVGDRVRIVPNHACVVVNQFDRMYLVDGHHVVDTFIVDARGRVT